MTSPFFFGRVVGAGALACEAIAKIAKIAKIGN